jgi:hypothetical protein
MKLKNRITVELKKLAKRDPRFYVHAERKFDAPSWSDEAVFTLSADLGRIGENLGPIVKVELPGIMGNGHNDETETYIYEGKERTKYSGVYRPERGYWSLWGAMFRDLILTLPDDASVKFRVSLDAGTSELHIPHKLHSDRIYLEAEWKRGERTVRRTYLVDTETGYHNTARFGSPGR